MLHSIDQVIEKIRSMETLARYVKIHNTNLQPYYKKHCLEQIQALAADIVNDKQTHDENV
jgi:hypothetical protein